VVVLMVVIATVAWWRFVSVLSEEE